MPDTEGNTLDTDAIVALSPAEAETVARALQGDAIAARRLDRHDLADTLDDLATRITGAIPVGSAS